MCYGAAGLARVPPATVSVDYPQLLGKGGFARCYRARCVENGRDLAIKVASAETLSRKTREKLSAEIRIHRDLSHAHVVRLERCFEDVGGSVYLVLELCEHRSLAEVVRRKGRMEEGEVRRLASQLLDAMRYLHSVRVIHRDLKVRRGASRLVGASASRRRARRSLAASRRRLGARTLQRSCASSRCSTDREPLTRVVCVVVRRAPCLAREPFARREHAP